MPAKACSRCGATKPASDFNINKTTSSGLTSHCKVLPSALRRLGAALRLFPVPAGNSAGRANCKTQSTA